MESIIIFQLPIGEKLDQELRHKNNKLNPFDFKKYCDVPTKNWGI